eukprot:TRINITY_DN7402_c0_g1_i1.p1 TRINITY_DN7402_c0_g1~~TRINITY_DN7402_c0_g1_i1.p1  ORF type:complete len:383 (-),score=48.66 TRINITY_DN7402_c0_g1_i1:180-1328(-)
MKSALAEDSEKSMSYQSTKDTHQVVCDMEKSCEAEKLHKQIQKDPQDNLQWTILAFTAALSAYFLSRQYGDSTGFRRALVLAVVIQMIRLVLFPINFLLTRYWTLPQYIGMSEEDIEIFLSPAPLPLESWLQKYDERKIIIRDSLQRKVPHILIILCELGSCCLFMRYFGASPSEVTTAAVTASTISCTIQTIVVSSKEKLSRSAWLSCTACFFICNRIRDGKLRYENNLVVTISSAWARIATNVTWWLLVLPFYHPSEASLLLAIMWVPLAIGDAMAEIIGGCFGTHFFEVYGFGEINRKTLEGVAGMFFSSVGSTLLCILRAWSQGGLVTFGLEEWCFWALVAATLATIAETFSPRGTDNFTIPMSSSFAFSLAGYLHAH